MTYNKNDIEKKSLKVIQEKKIVKITHLVAYLPCTRATFYNLGLDKLDSIKDAIEDNKIVRKTNRLDVWEQSENATLQIAFFKQIADEDELSRLNKSEVKLDGDLKVETITGMKVI